jgi:preprotein translocase subunit SecG
MKLAAVVFNVVLVAFTCLVVVTDGPPTEAIYVVFTLALVLIPILSVTVLLHPRAGGGHPESPVKGDASPEEKKDGNSSAVSGMRTTAILCNIFMFGLLCWALVDQYPHPEEDGFVAYVLIVAITPLLNVVALVRSGGGAQGRTVRAE